jgi:hypothetical protein
MTCTTFTVAMFKHSSTLIRLVILAALASPAFAQDLTNRPGMAPVQTTGIVRFNVVKIGLIVGIGGGDGILTYNGVDYPLRVGGVSIGTIGIAGMELVGTASNLRSAGDIAGTYGGASASLAVVGGGKVAQLQNEHGVILEVQGAQVGFEASLNLGGMTIALR